MLFPPLPTALQQNIYRHAVPPSATVATTTALSATFCSTSRELIPTSSCETHLRKQTTCQADDGIRSEEESEERQLANQMENDLGRREDSYKSFLVEGTIHDLSTAKKIKYDSLTVLTFGEKFIVAP